MSRLEKFLAKPIKKTIDGEEFDVYGLDFRDVNQVVKLGSTDENVRASAIKEVVRIGIKKSIPDATEAEIDGLNAYRVFDWFMAILEASGLEVDQKKLEEMMAPLTSQPSTS